jgi:hypothetical protein
MGQDPWNLGDCENSWRKWVMVAEVDKHMVVGVATLEAAMVPDHLLIPLE